MDMTRNGSFVTGLFQGLVVVFFVYVVIFTVTIVKSRSPSESAKPLALATTQITRMNTQPQVEAVVTPHLEPQDQAPAPVAEQHASEPVAEHPLEPVSEHPSEQAHAPAPEAHGFSDLIEMTPLGPLPKRSASGQTPYDAYKKPYTPDGSPAIALVVLDYGMSAIDSKEALKKLPGEVSLILNPYAQTPDTWKSLAGAEGHEFWVFMPVESQDYPTVTDPGPQALLAHSDFKYNQEKFLWALSRTSGYAGIAGYTDTAFLNAQSALKSLWNEGYDRGIGYLEINPAGLEGVEMNAIEKKAPYIRNHSIYEEGAQSPEAWLKALEMEATNNGFTVGIIKRPYPKVVDAVAAWSATLKDRGYSLAPVSALAQANKDVPETPPSAAPAAAEHHETAPAH
ncbi:MAG: divergent polysaccharide deacetylase family protein [Alphaproteobacteria bacterium]|nr:divergent polysaccharide deacetylase family protein [Alphaproteobacteria bacterium]